MSRSVHHSTFTTIGDNVSCGIHANVSHDVRVGNSTTISSKVVLAGRAQIGANVWIGAGALISNGVKIGSRAKLRIGAVVIDDVPDNADFSGNFAIPHRKSLYEWANKSRIKIQ
jgi:UDP-3-O-[3-hydroxymyristoyl] glucosamine N-acyltransferase